MAYDEALAQRIRQLLQGPDVVERKMFGGLAMAERVALQATAARAKPRRHTHQDVRDQRE